MTWSYYPTQYPYFVRNFRKIIPTGILHKNLVSLRQGGLRTLPSSTDTDLDCVFAKSTVFTIVLDSKKNNKTELVRRPLRDQARVRGRNEVEQDQQARQGDGPTKVDPPRPQKRLRAATGSKVTQTFFGLRKIWACTLVAEAVLPPGFQEKFAMYTNIHSITLRQWLR